MPKLCPVCAASYPDPTVFCPADGSPLRLADTGTDLVGSVIADRYLVTELLGRGGMGEVYRARHVRLPREVAIKVLKAELAADAAAVARFNQEAKSAAQISSERVAAVHDFGETSEGLVYLAMDYVPGVALRRILEEESPLSPARVATVVGQVADGLEAAHRLGIVHRDIKPDNIMVVRDGEEWRCKVVDFGIAKAALGQRLTGTGMVVGTREYMSPEQLMGEDLDGRSDVYALAIVAYECLTGDLPFDQNTPDRGMSARLHRQPRRLEELRREQAWPPALQAALDGALERDVDRRTASAPAFARAFSEAVTARVSAPQPRPPEQTTPKVAAARPNTAKVGGGVVLVALAAGGLLWMTNGDRPGGGGPGAVADTASQPDTAKPDTAKLKADTGRPATDTSVKTPPKPQMTAADARRRLETLSAELEALPDDPSGAATARRRLPEIGRLMAALTARRDSAVGHYATAMANLKANPDPASFGPVCQQLAQVVKKAPQSEQAVSAGTYRVTLECP
jgi:eukaryotic-like serine/threonine-protein kinase